MPRLRWKAWASAPLLKRVGPLMLGGTGLTILCCVARKGCFLCWSDPVVPIELVLVVVEVGTVRNVGYEPSNTAKERGCERNGSSPQPESGLSHMPPIFVKH